ncbi:MAG: laccase domain-containing protein, partial [Rhodocyclaceae bacterium]|nr:laccase domain-containing protein [Rhodocyclaceae bacterium]
MKDCIVPDWPAPAHVRALVTTRAGGVSRGPYAAMNLALHVGDDAAAVAENRRRPIGDDAVLHCAVFRSDSSSSAK